MARALAIAGAALAAAVAVAGLAGLGGQEDLGYKELLAFAAGATLVAAGTLLRLGGRFALGLGAFVALLAVGTLAVQYHAVGELYPDATSARLIEEGQLGRHEATLAGDVGDPWRFRLLGEWLAAAALWAARGLEVWRPELVGFLGLRLAENLAIFALAWMLFRRLGARREHAALGLCLVAWGMANANYHSALSYDTYLELVLFEAGALLALARRHAWLIPLTALAVANRESSLLIAAIPLALAWLGPRASRREALRAGVAALVAGAAVIVAIRLAVGPAELVHPEDQRPGLGLFAENLANGRMWANLFATMTLLPLIAALAWPRWPRALKAIAVAVVPIWLAVHLVATLPEETRLLLVPYVLVVVPGAIAAIASTSRSASERSL